MHDWFDRRLRNALALGLLCVGGSSLVVAQRVSTDERAPKLIVLLAVDQMRADYIDRLQQQWSHGLKRLVTQGAWFRQPEYPYYNTVTCGTGDDSAKTISYGKPVTGAGESPARLRTTTLADELRAQLSPAARIIGFSLKARSVVTLSGQRPTAAAWFDDSGTWGSPSPDAMYYEVYTRDELIADRFDDDPIARRAARSFYAPRSGDLVVSLKPYWIIQVDGATHGTGYGYDTHVPLLLMGKSITRGEYRTPASPTDIAPTLAFLAGITLPRVSGRVLIEALTQKPSANHAAPAAFLIAPSHGTIDVVPTGGPPK